MQFSLSGRCEELTKDKAPSETCECDGLVQVQAFCSAAPEKGLFP